MSAAPATSDVWARALDQLAERAVASRHAALQHIREHVSAAMEIWRTRALADESTGDPAEIVTALRRDLNAELDRIEAALRAGRI